MEQVPVTRMEGGCAVCFKVTARASRTGLCGLQAGAVKLKVVSPPVDNKANREIMEFLADLFRIPKKSIRIISGELSNRKRIFIPVSQEVFMSKAGL